MLGLLDLILRHIRLVFGLAITLALATGVAVLLSTRMYTSSASFLPQAPSNSQSVLSGVAAQFGIVATTDQSGQSPDFYVSLLQQKSMVGRVVDTSYAAHGQLQAKPLKDILVDHGSPAERRRTAMSMLERQTRISLENKIGLVKISVSSHDPTLSKQIVDNYLRFVNDANLEIRRQRAAEEARFIDDRLTATRAELFGAEDRLQFFLKSNRDVSDVGELVFQRDRLQREVQLRQQIYSSLAQAYEQSRLDEVRDTPVITLVEQPVIAPFPDSRHLGVKVALAALLGALLGIFIAWLSELAHLDDDSLADVGESRRLLARSFRGDFWPRKVGGAQRRGV